VRLLVFLVLTAIAVAAIWVVDQRAHHRMRQLHREHEQQQGEQTRHSPDAHFTVAAL
jgi:cell division protein FtsL